MSGDVLLEEISPAVGLYPESRADPLADYLRSLRRIVELDPRIAYGATGSRFARPPSAPASSSRTTSGGSRTPARRSAPSR
jgi:glyoxylase-like metal-dependent hydrolase (beta-lactamase superfamily II)